MCVRRRAEPGKPQETRQTGISKNSESMGETDDGNASSVQWGQAWNWEGTGPQGADRGVQPRPELGRKAEGSLEEASSGR